ncbi:MAG: ABC transporter permease [Desulfitobacteriaceae bacterium]
MYQYVLKRVLGSISLLFIVSFFTFLVLHLLPGDAAQIKLGLVGSQESLVALRKAMGLDIPWYLQYFHWLRHALQGDLGQSAIYGIPVSELIAQRLPVTLSLMVLTMAMSVTLAFALGTLAAVRENSWIDRISRTVMQLGLAVPPFWVGIVLILLFSLLLPVFPPGGYSPMDAGFFPYLKSLVLPAVSLAFVEVGILLRMVRTSMLQVLRQDYIRFARSKGISPIRLYIKYGLKNAIIAPLTLIGLQLSSLLGGTVVIEEVFALPGLGRLLFTAVQQRDLALLQGATLFVTCSVILVNFLIDLIYAKIDPRIDLSGQSF